MKNPLTSAGIEPATFRLVAQHLNHCATAVAVLLRDHVVFDAINLYDNGTMRNEGKAELRISCISLAWGFVRLLQTFRTCTLNGVRESGGRE